MPVYDNPALDDPLIFDGQQNFSGGENRALSREILADNEAQELLNMDVFPSGIVQTRYGVRWLNNVEGQPPLPVSTRVQGMGYYDTPLLERMVIASNGLLWKFDGAAYSALAGYTPADAARQVEFAQLSDKLYITDGSGHVHEWDGTTMTDLGTGGTNPPICGVIVSHTGRLFAAVGSPERDTVWVSDILDGTTWDYVTQSFRVGGGDGDPIVGLCAWKQFFIVVLKRGSIWVVNADPQIPVAQWTVENVSQEVGCIAHRSAVQVGDDVLFLARDGVRSVAQTLSEKTIGIQMPITGRIQPLIDRINWDYAYKSAAIFWDNKYWLSVPIDGALENNAVFVFNTLTKSWLGIWTGAVVGTEYVITRFNEQSKLCIGGTDGRVGEWLTAGAIDDEQNFLDYGDDYGSEILTRGFSFREPISEKSGFHVELTFEKSFSDAELWGLRDTFSTTAEGEKIWEGPTYNDGPYLDIPLDFLLDYNPRRRQRVELFAYERFRDIAFLIKTDGGLLRLRSLAVSAFVESFQNEEGHE